MPRPDPPAGLAAILVVARTSVGGALRGKRLWGLLVLVGLPVLVQGLISAFGEGRSEGNPAFLRWVQGVYLSFILPMVLLFLGTACFGDEWDGGTAPYVVGLPLPRAALVLGRWLVTAARGLLVVLPSLGVLALQCLLPHEGALAHYAGDLALIVLVLAWLGLGYAAVFLYAGLALKHSIMAALIYLIVLEGFVGNLPPGLAVLSMSFHARNILLQLTGQDAFKTIAFDAPGALGEPPTVLASWITIGVFTTIFLAAAVITLKRKQFTGAASSDGPTASAG